MAQEKPKDTSYEALEKLLTNSVGQQTTAQEQTNLLNQASEAAYQKQQIANQQAQNQFAQNTSANQMSALDAIRKSNASAIANGANAGLSAANQLSSILGLQEATSEEATKLANADINAAAQYNEQLNQNAVAGQKAANDFNLGLGANQAEIGKALSELEKAEAQKYAADKSAETSKKGIESQETQTGSANKANQQAVDNAQREANYKRSEATLDGILADWGDGTYAESYWDPQTEEDKEKGGSREEIQKVINNLKAELSAAYNSGDTTKIEACENKILKFQNSLKTAEEDSCLAPGTLITMADGLTKKVEEIQARDLVLVWNLEEGCLDISPVLFNDVDPEAKHEIIQLDFSNGSKVRMVYEHGFFDKDTMRYEYIHNPKEAQALIGHHFLRQVDNGLVEVVLTNVEHYQDTIPTYSPCSAKHLCIFAEGILTMPGATDTFNNFIKINKETLAYDQKDLTTGLEQFGYCPYEEVAAISNLVTRELYEAFQMKYFNINIGRKHSSINKIKQLLTRYKSFL